MADQGITNPLAAYTTVSDWRTMKDASGGAVPAYSKVEYFIAKTAITAGKVVAIDAPSSATNKFGVIHGTASTLTRNIGVAQKTAAAGDLVPVVTEGLAFATTAGATLNLPQAVDADGYVIDVTVAAATVLGAVIATALATAASGTIPVWITKV